MRSIATLLAGLALVPGLALGCGPTRLKVVQSIEIRAPADKVWAVIGNFRDMSWHPAIARTEAPETIEPEVTTRTLTYKSGSTVTDKLTKYDAAQRAIGFMADKEDQAILPVVGYNSILTAKDHGGATLLEWRGAFMRGYPLPDPPPAQNDEAAERAVTAYQKAGLDAVKKLMEGG
ncbi:MAG: SRPBCC family protein [Hyphomicrobium sp.]|jgi:hypothetical protein